MEAGGGAGPRGRRAALLETEEEVLRRKAELEFNNTLYSGKSGYEISLVQRIAVAKEGAPCVVIYDMDWNPRPNNCRGKDAIAILACISSFGLHIYCYPRTTMKWTTMVIKHRPSRHGSCLRWHKSGKALACLTDPIDGMQAKLTTFVYDKNHLRFQAKHDFLSKCRLSSLAWIARGEVIVCSRCTTATLKFLGYNEDGSLFYLYERNCEGFPDGSAISLQAEPSENYFFSSCDKSSTILFWGFQDGGYNILRTVNCGSGVNGLSFSRPNSTLFSLHENHWKSWKFAMDKELELTFTSVNEHKLVMGKKMRWRSNLMSFSASWKANLVASGGSGDTFVAYVKAVAQKGAKECPNKEWIPVCSRKRNFTFGEVRSMEFNRQDITTMRLATGTTTGFIHIWELKKTTIRRDVFPARRFEFSYYNRNLDIAAYVPTAYAVEKGFVESDEGQEEEEEGFVVESASEEVEVEYDEGQDEEEKIELDSKIRWLGRVRGGRVKMGGQADQSEDQRGKTFDLIAKNAKDILKTIEDGNKPATRDVKSLCERILNVEEEFKIIMSKDN